MLIAGEASGDLLAAELVSALLAASKRSEDGRVPQFLARAVRAWQRAVDLAFDMTQHSGHRHFRRAEKLFQVPAAVQPTACAGN